MNAYLIILAGQGDIRGFLVNDDAWAWLSDGSNPVTDTMVDDYIAAVVPYCDGPNDPEINPDYVRKQFETASGYRINDKALTISCSRFNGKSYDTLDHSHRKLASFLKKNKLTLKHEWQGYNY